MNLKENNAAVKQVRSEEENLNKLIIESIKDIKGANIIELDLRDLDDSPADFFIICEGGSTTQVKAISDNIQKRVKKELYVSPLHVEGVLSSKWILVDYFDTVVHVFHPDFRSFYDLEGLWSDARHTEISSL